MLKIEIYSTAMCPYCVNAKQLLANKMVEFEEIRVDQDPNQFNIMLKRSNGARTVPQIFINDLHVGGFDDLSALNSTGKLDQILEEQL